MTIDDTRALITSDESQTLEKKTCLTEVDKEWKYNNRKLFWKSVIFRMLPFSPSPYIPPLQPMQLK